MGQPAQFVGTYLWQKINTETGEVVNQRTVAEFEKPIDGRKEDFMITYLGEIIKLLDKLGNKKMIVVRHLLSEMNKSNNMLLTTTRELAKELKVSTKTVNDTLKMLQEANIIKRRTGAIMVSPKLMNNWKPYREATMMITYKDFSADREEINITPKGENNEILE